MLSHKTLPSFAVLGTLVVLNTSCVAYSLSPVTGLIYTDVKGPFTATSNAEDTKEASAECQSVLGLVATGDCSIATAAKKGGITRIHHVDFKSKSVLGIFTKFTVTVYGE